MIRANDLDRWRVVVVGTSLVERWTDKRCVANRETKMCYALVDDLGGVVLNLRDG